MDFRSSRGGTSLDGEFRKRIIPGFPYNIIYRVWDEYIYLVAVAPTNIVVQAIGATNTAVASQRWRRRSRSSAFALSS